MVPRKFHAAPGSLTRTPIEHLHMETRHCGEGKDNAMHVCFASFTAPKQALACHKSCQHELGGGMSTRKNFVKTNKFDLK